MSGKIQKYFYYAIGEILLVMVGILLALQVNTWNTKRINKIEEKEIEENLHREFSQNKQALDRNLNILNACIESCNGVMGLIGKEPDVLGKINLDSLLFVSIEFEDYSPSQNVFSDLIQSGRLSLLKNQTLRDQLFEWSRVLGQKEIEYETVQSWANNEMLPYLVDNVSIKNIDYYGGKLWDSPSPLPNSNMHIFTDLTFENLMDNWIYDLLKLKKELLKLQNIIDRIIDETEKKRMI